MTPGTARGSRHGFGRWLRSWGVSLRLARREARRHKGRSAMVAALIGAPVVALAFIAVTYDTFDLTREEKLTRLMGAADALVNWGGDSPVQQIGDSGMATQVMPPSGPAKPKTDATLLALLPPGSKVSQTDTSGLQLRMRTPGGVGGLQARYVDMNDPMAKGIATTLGGRPPANAGEAALSPEAADRLDAKIGDTVRTFDDDKAYTVTGLIEFPDDLRETMLLHPAALDRRDVASGAWLIEVPGDVTLDLFTKLNQAGAWVTPRADIPGLETSDPGQAEEFALGTVVIGLIVFEIVLLCGPAFAVGARRRRRELALVAANGGVAKQLRRIMLADGILLGVLGAIPGLAVGVVLAVAARPLLEEYNGARAGALRLFPLALAGGLVLAVITGLLAALVPAITAARQDVVTALAGRRGITRSRKRWVLAGVVMMAAGAAVAGGGTFVSDSTFLLCGLVLAQLGFVVVTPALMGLLGRLGRALPLAPRIALRDSARNRAAAAPAISAVMAVVTGSVMVGIFMNSESLRNARYEVQMLPVGYASVRLMDLGPTGARPFDAATTARLSTRLREILPVGETAVLDGVACLPPTGVAASSAPEERYCALEAVLPDREKCPYDTPPADPELQAKARADERCHEGRMWGLGFGAIVDDGTTLPLITQASADDLERATAVLRSGGVVVTDARYVVDGRVSVRPTIADGKGDSHGTPIDLPAYVLTTGVRGFDIALGSGALAKAGLGAEPSYLIAATTRAPSSEEEDKLNSTLLEFSQIAYGTVQRPIGGRLDLLLVILALASALVTLAAAAIATGLAAADGRADLATLGAVGASPRVRRLMSLSQSGVIAGLGTLLGLGVGVGGALALIAGVNRSQSVHIWPIPMELPLVVPWVQLVIAAAVPVVAMLGAGLLTRSRLPIERR
ncbi:MAG: FtsX-like permease family protein [Hamadaea sp.]|nr:FtsX-like permease family protein [Hamadaea sp.]